MTVNNDWLEWLKTTMLNRPKNNLYLDCERGLEVGKLCLDIERDLFSWRRSDPDTFWLDVQLFVKYKLSDDEIRFVCKMQGGVENFKAHSAEKNAYAEMKRGIEKLRAINTATATGATK